MRRIVPILCITAIVVAGCSDQTPTAPVVKRTGTPSLSVSGGASKHLVFANVDASATALAARVGALGGSVDAAYDGIGIVVASGLSDAAVAQLAADPSVSSVERDAEFQFIDHPGLLETAAADAVVESPSNPTTAFFYPRQWHLRAIGADAVWRATKLGSSNVRVAILDTGIDYLHADLNGRVDLANSASFVPSDDALVTALFPTRHPVTDLHYHGTHVGATVSSNALAAAGVTSRTTLMGVKVLNVNGSGTTSGILAGIVFATDRGADIINMSLGVRTLLNDKDEGIRGFQKMTNRAFQYAHSQGVTVIVSAGNESQDLDAKHTFKAYCSSVHVTCVSATGPTAQAGVNGPWTNIDASASYTNFGVRDVDVAAPGGNGASAVWAACSSSSLQIPVCRTGTFVVGLSGTSMASPHTAGVAALILSENGSLMPGDVRSILENTSDDLLPAGKDPRFGRGRINAARAVGL